MRHDAAVRCAWGRILLTLMILAGRGGGNAHGYAVLKDLVGQTQVHISAAWLTKCVRRWSIT
jgi:hypothetical protein